MPSSTNTNCNNSRHCYYRRLGVEVGAGVEAEGAGVGAEGAGVGAGVGVEVGVGVGAEGAGAGVEVGVEVGAVTV